MHSGGIVNNHKSGRIALCAMAALVFSTLAACGGGDDTGTGGVAKPVVMAAVKASLASTAIPIQRGQAVSNLSSDDGSADLWYSLTLPAGANAIKIATSGATGTPLLNVTTKTDPAASYTTCSGQSVCQLAFSALTQPTTYYINVGTRSSYSNATLMTYVAPTVIPLDSGSSIGGLSGVASDTPAMFSIVVPAGSKNFTMSLSGGTGSAALSLIRGTTDMQYSSNCGNPCNITNPTANTYYMFVAPGAPSASYSDWTLTSTVS